MIDAIIYWAGAGFLLTAYGLWGLWILILWIASKIEDRSLKNHDQ